MFASSWSFSPAIGHIAATDSSHRHPIAPNLLEQNFTVEFGQAAMPGAKGVFVFITDTFALPKGAKGRQAALDFLTLIGSVKGETVFNPIKGSTPPRIDADLTSYDALAKSNAEDFRTNRLVRATPILITSQDFSGLWPLDENGLHGPRRPASSSP